MAGHLTELQLVNGQFARVSSSVTTRSSQSEREMDKKHIVSIAMQFTTILPAVSNVTAAAVHAADCDLTFYDAISTQEEETCKAESGLNFSSPATLSDEVVKGIGLEECAIGSKKLSSRLPMTAPTMTLQRVHSSYDGGGVRSRSSKDFRDNSTPHNVHVHSHGSGATMDTAATVAAPRNSKKPINHPHLSQQTHRYRLLLEPSCSQSFYLSLCPPRRGKSRRHIDEMRAHVQRAWGPPSWTYLISEEKCGKNEEPISSDVPQLEIGHEPIIAKRRNLAEMSDVSISRLQDVVTLLDTSTSLLLVKCFHILFILQFASCIQQHITMKFATAITAVATITLAATVHAAECDLKLNDAVSIPEQSTCEVQSGFDFAKLATPTGDAMTKFCNSAACMTVWSAAKSAGLPECTIRGKQLYADLLDPIEAACKKGSTATNNTTDDSHDHVHGSGSGHGSGSVEDSSDDDSMVKAPANSTTTPTPSPRSAATSLSVAAVGAVVCSIAAAVY
ncbi:Elicitin-like protein, partial [Globisporangium splendens]